MADELAYVTYPGLTAIRDASYTLAHGRTPGIVQISCFPQPTLPQAEGDVTFHYGATRVVVKNCIIDQATLSIDGSGQVIGMTLLDRRWKWRFEAISGRYNIYKENGDLDDVTRKTARELAALCLNEMHETGYSVADVPNDTYPEVDWNFTNAAEALEQLCELLGCRLVFDNNRVAIRKLGEGAQLPNTADISSGGLTIDPPEMPDSIFVAGRPTQYQQDFELEAVGYELDGETLVPIDDLSYKPAAGWDFADVLGDCNSLADVKLRALAKASVFRIYRIKMPSGGIFHPDLTLSETFRIQNIELLPHQVYVRELNGIDEPVEPYVYGVFFDDRDKHDNNTADGLKPLSVTPSTDYDKVAIYQDGHHVDLATHTVRFARPVYKHTESANGHSLGAADLRLRIAYNLRDDKTRSLQYSFGGTGTGARVLPDGSTPIVERIFVSEITYKAVKDYLGNSGTLDEHVIVTNADAYIPQATEFAKARLREYRQLSPQHIVYDGIRLIHLDGAIQQVSWSVGGGVSKTVANRNNDTQDYMPSYQERRWRQKINAFFEQRAKEDKR